MVFSLPARRQNLEIEKTAHNVIVVDRERDYVHVLNERAANVLEQCDGSHTCDEIARIVSEKTRAPYDRVAQEVAHLVASFADLALIEAGRA
jgi:hypothetical protein